VGWIDNDPHRGKGEPMRGCEPRHDMGFHIDRGCTSRSVHFPFYCRLGDRGIHADDRGVACPSNHFEEPARPRSVRLAHGVRFEDGGRDDPVSGAKTGRKSAGNAEADVAVLSLPRSALSHRRQLAPGAATDDQHAGSGAILASKAMPTNAMTMRG
jgi:hypothetical protein